MVEISVAEIKRNLAEQKTFSYSLEPEELNISERDIHILGTINAEGKISNVGRILFLEAVITAKVQHACNRCLKELVTCIKAEVTEEFYISDTEGIEQDVSTCDSDILDITEPLREGLLLAEPMQTLCKEDCLGLCPICGTDLNTGCCDCDRTSFDPRLTVLKKLRKN
ncbi:MAG: DUF177 domain-containing protein [Phascolarctobacterium sp.]|nr:DUF177 domain-containing protein [Phascolarctobacterium sp.]